MLVITAPIAANRRIKPAPRNGAGDVSDNSSESLELISSCHFTLGGSQATNHNADQ
jgi:hypothetical protein